MGRALASIPLAAALLAGCGGGHATTTSPAAAPPPAATTAPAAGALRPEAGAAAAGDIPDNQMFLTFRNASAGYSIKYPEGWATSGSGKTVTFRDKNNVVRVVVEHGGLPGVATARRDLGASVRQAPKPFTVSGAPAVKAVYATESARNAVTGKRVTLVVDRYYLTHAGRVAIVDLGTPEGVDNVDAYRLMVESFRWK